MSAVLEIYPVATPTTALGSVFNLGDNDSGTTVSMGSYQIKNNGDATATDIRIGIRTGNGVYSGQLNSLGQELLDEKWVQVRVAAGAWQSIGGDFSISDSAANYKTLSDLTAGSTSSQVDFQLVIPSSVSTAGSVRFHGILVSYNPG